MAKKPTYEMPFVDETAVFHPDVPVEVMAAIARLEQQDKLVNCDVARTATSEPSDWKLVSEHVNKLHDRVEGLLAPLEFEYAEGRPLMVVKLGSEGKGWIPNQKHFDKVRKVLKSAGEDKRNNILLYHYGILIEKHG